VPEEAKKVLSLASELEDLDDVQKVFANFDIPDTLLATLS
jgi:transcriptional/translational regulatory protein YebC/TACO1